MLRLLLLPPLPHAMRLVVENALQSLDKLLCAHASLATMTTTTTTMKVALPLFAVLLLLGVRRRCTLTNNAHGIKRFITNTHALTYTHSLESCARCHDSSAQTNESSCAAPLAGVLVLLEINVRDGMVAKMQHATQTLHRT